MHIYWCHKTEALKSNCKKQYTYFHSGPGFLTRNTYGTHRWQKIISQFITYHRLNELSKRPHIIIEQLDYFHTFPLN